MITTAKQFLESVEFHRKKNRIEKQELCRIAGISRSTYSHWLNNRSEPELDTALRIASAAGLEFATKSNFIRNHETLLHSPEALEYMQELRDQGMTLSDIAVAFQTSQSTISKWISTSRQKKLA